MPTEQGPPGPTSRVENRVHIEDVRPAVSCGRHAAKAVVGDDVVVSADILREGHEQLAAAVRYRGPDGRGWREAPLRHGLNDRWYGSFPVDALGAWRFHIIAWTDEYATWIDGLGKKRAAGETELAVELEEGARLLERRSRQRMPKSDQRVLADSVRRLRGEALLDEKVAAAHDPELLAVLERHPERADLTQSAPDLPLWADRPEARFSAWYELFPRSEGATETRSGTLREAARRLPTIAEMGFDVVYLPPIHPIGVTGRKGRGGPHDLSPGPDDPGSPWAIGSREGGHESVHPDLGTLDDFDHFVSEAKRHGMEVALDYALQCSPDHPWVTEHPQWFRRRADGTVAFAENPPKRYQDIYPINFDTPDYANLRAKLKDVLDHWIAHGVRVFRVDNPHTKPLPFWEWLIAEVRREHPDVLFLAEAFTRPKMMHALAKLGFSQSYTYFAWRNTKQELTDYLVELTQTDVADFFRPSFWPNTPDILTEYLQRGGRPAFKTRLLLAALLSPAYGIYSGFELCENRPLHEGSEEYWASEKYRYRPRDWDRADSLAPYISRVNRIRRENTAFRHLRNLWFHHIDNDRLLCFSKVGPQRTEPVLVVVNLDPHRAHEATTWLDMWQLGLEHVETFEAHDLLTDTRYVWHGPANYVRLDPHEEPAHVLRLRPL